MWVDSHCHLDADTWPLGPDAVLARARAAGVVGFVVVGVGGVAAARGAVDLATRNGDVWAVVGVHPHDAAQYAAMCPEIVPLLGVERVVGVGETGLDYHYDHAPRVDQHTAFRASIAEARQAKLPIVVHTRSAAADTLAILTEEDAREVGGVIHCFSEDRAFARSALDLGFYLSFSGIVTFRNAAAIRDVAAWAPSDRVLIETDSPYLAPEPFRGRTCEPAYVVHTARRIAELRGMTLDRFADLTMENTARLFGLPLGRMTGTAHPA
ncbi:MAG: TatD family hydrolase [Polyangiaceae bacterium]|nr:TatD family hydrolase [Polyangiaceae bacterium]